MRWLRKQIWGKRDFLRNIEDDTYEQVIFIQMWNFTTSYRQCSLIMQKLEREKAKLLEVEEDDTIKEQIATRIAGLGTVIEKCF